MWKSYPIVKDSLSSMLPKKYKNEDSIEKADGVRKKVKETPDSLREYISLFDNVVSACQEGDTSHQVFLSHWRIGNDVVSVSGIKAERFLSRLALAYACLHLDTRDVAMWSEALAAVESSVDILKAWANLPDALPVDDFRTSHVVALAALCDARMNEHVCSDLNDDEMEHLEMKAKLHRHVHERLSDAVKASDGEKLGQRSSKIVHMCKTSQQHALAKCFLYSAMWHKLRGDHMTALSVTTKALDELKRGATPELKSLHNTLIDFRALLSDRKECIPEFSWSASVPEATCLVCNCSNTV